MNQHLNLYRFYNENTEKVFIENNLSRALAICLLNDALFLSECLKSIITTEDYRYLFSTLTTDSNFGVDLQVDTANIDKEEFSRVYAVATTADKNLRLDDFFNQPEFKERKNITDIYISIKDIAIIFEVKRTNENCSAQLFNQILPFYKADIQVIPKNLSWQEIIKQMEKINHLQKLSNLKSTFINDFLKFSEIRFPEWFEPKPFSVIHFQSKYGSKQYIQLKQRMQQGLNASKYEILEYSDRLGVAVPFRWANEILVSFISKRTKLKNELEDFITFSVYPGNTKQQGYHIFNRDLMWKNVSSLNILNKNYDISITYHLKFSHFNRYVTGLWFEKQDLKKEIATIQNFHKSGKKNRNQWDDFEVFMDEHLNTEYNWRKQCNWDEAFLNTDRNYFTFSIGFEITAFIPFSVFKQIDKKDEDFLNVGKTIDKIADSFQNLIEGL